MAFVRWPSTAIYCRFLFPTKRSYFYAKNKISKYYFYCSDGLLWLEYIVVFCLIFFLITNTSKKLAFRIIQPNCLPPIFTILSIQCFTVCQIVPVITLFATFVHNGITPDWFFQWIKLAVICFPMALCIQVFFAGPLVRFVFRALFKNN